MQFIALQMRSFRFALTMHSKVFIATDMRDLMVTAELH